MIAVHNDNDIITPTQVLLVVAVLVQLYIVPVIRCALSVTRTRTHTGVWPRVQAHAPRALSAVASKPWRRHEVIVL